MMQHFRSTHMEADESQLHECNICSIACNSKQALNSHIRKYHKETDNNMKAREIFECAICELKYKNKASLTYHKAIKHSLDQSLKCTVTSKLHIKNC